MCSGIKVLQIVEEDKLINNVNEQGVYLKAGITKLKTSYDFIDVVRGKGLLMGFEFNPSIKGLQHRFIDSCFSNGLLVYPAVGGKEGKDENGVLISPPFIISRSEADELLDKLERSLKEVSKRVLACKIILTKSPITKRSARSFLME